MFEHFVEYLLSLKTFTHRHAVPLLAEHRSIDSIQNLSAHHLAILTRYNKWQELYTHIQSYSANATTLDHDIPMTVYADKNYPEGLLTIPDPPALLYFNGNSNIEYQKSIAIVGTRKCTSYALEACGYFSRELSKLGFTIISGLANGIDTKAHRSCLEASGRTCAVIGSGFNAIYPKNNTQLLRDIIEQSGVVFSEYSPKTSARTHHFPMRNRIVAGLSRAIIVVEAPEKSGSLITAKLGLDYNRDVLVVPGQIFQKGFKGSHALIQEGAMLIQTIDDVLEYFSELSFLSSHISEHHIKLDAISTQIVAQLQIEPVTIDELSMLINVSFSELQVKMSELEIKKIVYLDQSLRYHSCEV